MKIGRGNDDALAVTDCDICTEDGLLLAGEYTHAAVWRRGAPCAAADEKLREGALHVQDLRVRQQQVLAAPSVSKSAVGSVEACAAQMCEARQS